MAKVHPNSVVAVPVPVPVPAAAEPAAANRSCAAPSPPQDQEPPTVLTVWRKSLLFNCHGLTVFDAKGDLAFRVDCYGGNSSSRRRAEVVVLMDAAGKPLLTVRRKRLLLGRLWQIYDGDYDDDDGASKNNNKTPLVSVRRSSSKALARVTSSSPSSLEAAASSSSYVVEGSYARRACAVRDANGDAVAEVRRKQSVGDEVFRLVVADPRRWPWDSSLHSTRCSPPARCCCCCVGHCRRSVAKPPEIHF